MESWLVQSSSNLRGRRSKGVGKGIRARDRARGRREKTMACLQTFPSSLRSYAPKFPLPPPLLKPRGHRWFPRRAQGNQRWPWRLEKSAQFYVCMVCITHNVKTANGVTRVWADFQHIMKII